MSIFAISSKIHPRNHYVYKVLSNFPAGMIFHHNFFLQKGIIFCGILFSSYIFQFSGKFMFLRKKVPQKGIPFPGARARSEPFSSSRAHGKCIFPDFTPKSGNDSILAPKSQNYQNFSLLEQK